MGRAGNAHGMPPELFLTMVMDILRSRPDGVENCVDENIGIGHEDASGPYGDCWPG